MVVVVLVVVICSFPSDTMIVSEITGFVSLCAIFSSSSTSLAAVQRVKRHSWQSSSGLARMRWTYRYVREVRQGCYQAGRMDVYRLPSFRVRCCRLLDPKLGRYLAMKS